ncbi:hypothetical protein AAVH_16964 [Aphelenchoides avenae]|nr:hypothetical protein AAVH_16964 [Aphelenchus avenae]
MLADTSARVDTRELYPLGGEAHSDVDYPLRPLFYSVSECARYVYVVGENAWEQRTITVWDLHRGAAFQYRHNVNLIQHFYEINRQLGFAVGKAASAVDLVLVSIDHRDRQITARHVMHSIQLSPLLYWNSARCGSGYVVLAHNDRRLCVYRYEPGGTGRSTWIHVTSPSVHSHRFLGQPFAFGQHLYLFEADTSLRSRPTGRLFRIDMDRGSICLSRTSPAMHKDALDENFPFGDGQSLPNRVKHVERNGELWLIGEADAEPRECFIAVLSLRTFRWRRARLDVRRAALEDLSLDVTRGGIVIMRTRRSDGANDASDGSVETFSTFSTRQVPSLERCAFLTLLQNFPAIRHLPTSDLIVMGIPKKYLD